MCLTVQRNGQREQKTPNVVILNIRNNLIHTVQQEKMFHASENKKVVIPCIVFDQILYNTYAIKNYVFVK